MKLYGLPWANRFSCGSKAMTSWKEEPKETPQLAQGLHEIKTVRP